MTRDKQIQVANYLKLKGLARFGVRYNKENIEFDTKMNVLDDVIKSELQHITSAKDVDLREFDDKLNKVIITL